MIRREIRHRVFPAGRSATHPLELIINLTLPFELLNISLAHMTSNPMPQHSNTLKYVVLAICRPPSFTVISINIFCIDSHIISGDLAK